MDVKNFDINGKIIRYIYTGDGLAVKTLTWHGKNILGIKLASGSDYLKANDKV
jgi:hypothetical protein